MKMFSWLSGLQKKTDMRQRWNRPGKHRARPGRRQNAEALESRIVLAAPTLSAISDVTFFSGSAFHIPLNAEDTDGDSLMFTALSADPALSTDVLTGNRSLRIAVEQGDPMSPTISGEMTFELFEDEASRATNRIITLAESGFYDASTFHRVIDNFVIQGGDPNGVPSGTGGSMLGDFDDQFDFDLQHNRTGMLSYAKSSDDTNDSQFFVTEYADPTVVNTNLRNLDSNHSVFGVQTTGEAIRAAISDTSTGVSDVPDVDVVLTSVTVFLDTQNGVLRINAPEGTTGSTTVTVTVSDGSETDQQTFNVSFTPDTANNNPFLADIPSIRTLAETPTTFQLTALDVETGGTTAAFLDQVELSNRALFVPLTANPAEVSYNTVFETGLTTVTPATSFVGTTAVSVSTGEFTSALDYQVVDIEVVGAAEPLTVSAAEHPGLTEANDGEADEIRLVRNGSKFEIFVNGQVTAQAEDVSVTTLTIDGSRDDDTLIIDYSGGNPFPAGGIVFNGYTVDPGEQSPPADTGIDSLEFTGGAVATATYTFTNATDGSVNLDGGVLTYVGLEPIKDNLSVTDRVFTYSSVADVITTGDDGVAANGLSRIATGGTGETVDFTTPSGSLTINAGDGADSVTVGNLDSGPFAVTVNGGSGNDTVNGSSQGDLLNGDAGNDVIIGSLGDDSLNGGDGDDGLFGGGGADILGGGAGDDTVRGQAGGGDRVTGGGGADFLDGGSGADVIEESLTDATVTMTDTSLVGSETDVLAGIESAEIQFDGSSNSFDGSAVTFPMTVHGGGGNDTLFGGSAADELDGGDADDFLLGFGGNDTMTGGDGNDRLFGSAGIDIIDGGSGDDEVRGQGSSGDRMTGGAGDDTLNGGAGTDIIVESNDSDFVLSPGVLTGHGTDVLISVEQADLTGGAGNNTLDARTFTSAALSVSLRGAEGDDTLLAGSGPDGLFGDQGNDVMQGFDGNDDMYGGAGSDTVDGGAGNDFVRGQGASSDVVTGGVGDDTIDGGSGTDFLLETADVESLIITNTVMVGNGTDVIRGIERLDITGGAGNNMIDPRAFTPAGVNVIRGLGGDDQLFGTSERDVILGGAGDDTISGRDAADSIIGEAGNDSIEGGEGADVLNGNDGDDVINGDGGADFIQGEGGRDTLSGGLDADTLSGGTEDDSLDGGDGDDVLNGNAGDDVVNGDAGADSIDGEAGSDTLTGGLDEDTLRGGADDDNLDGGAGDDGLSGASGADFLLGNSGNDSIYGGSGNDTALGSGGQDSVIGGSGDDLVRGNGASDVLVGGSGTGSADAGDVFPDAITGEIDENFTLVPLPGWVEEV